MTGKRIAATLLASFVLVSMMRMTKDAPEQLLPSQEVVEEKAAAAASETRFEASNSGQTSPRSDEIPPEIASEVPADVNAASQVVVNDFDRLPGVMIATKIHGPAYVAELKQSLCLLTVAYNGRMKYDIVVFTTLSIEKEDEQILRDIVAPAKLIFEVDKQTLQQQLDDLTDEQRAHLLRRCNLYDTEMLYNSTKYLEWASRCKDYGHLMPLAYTWMSEFRAKYIWTHPTVANYQKMIWWDSDCMATQVWQQDPIAYLVRNELVMLMAHYGQGRQKGKEVDKKIYDSYNKSLCGLGFEGGHFVANYSDTDDCWGQNTKHTIHGMFHITDLDFYRQPINLNWYDTMIGAARFSRQWDDQLAVTIPPAMLAPDKAHDMEDAGLMLEVWHNGFISGKRKWKGGGYVKFFAKEGPTKFPEAIDKCTPYVQTPGR